MSATSDKEYTLKHRRVSASDENESLSKNIFTHLRSEEATDSRAGSAQGNNADSVDRIISINAPNTMLNDVSLGEVEELSKRVKTVTPQLRTAGEDEPAENFKRS